MNRFLVYYTLITCRLQMVYQYTAIAASLRLKLFQPLATLFVETLANYLLLQIIKPEGNAEIIIFCWLCLHGEVCIKILWKGKGVILMRNITLLLSERTLKAVHIGRCCYLGYVYITPAFHSGYLCHKQNICVRKTPFFECTNVLYWAFVHTLNDFLIEYS